ncbi:COG3650 family protein [Erythrobacter sp. QSSC1-22B]|uniref:COG3650 family protein n=1 Tax=Erythrobacter sp. QSSC1-22B TaxID=1860125 RepID=UPI000AA7FC8A|nr:hypothetical protein [Erythrobacter sp. QSSC1-22B]
MATDCKLRGSRNWHRLALATLPLLLAGCQNGTDSERSTEPYDGIAADETIRFTGTEPFWGGESAGGTLTYSTPETIDGRTISVERFAGNNGLSIAGELDGAAFDLVVTPGDCSDGMSDRTYPFVATLQIGEETRFGCAWTDRRSFEGSEAP